MIKFLKQIIPGKIKKVYWRYRKIRYNREIVGDNVNCPLCNSSFNFFASGGMDNRLNVRCHNCQSLERHRLLYLYMDQKLNFFKSSKKIKLLHFAPEKSLYQIFSNMSNVDYVPCDLFPDAYNYNGNILISKIDMTNIPYPEDTFDFILHNQVLEHIPNDNLAMKELYRVMRINGSGIFQVPIDYSRAVTYEDFSITTPEARKEAFGQHDHVRWYGKDYKDKLIDVGFKVKEDSFVQEFNELDISKYRLTPTELIYFVLKDTN